MKILVIDSHKGSVGSIPQNLHWKNSKIIADYLGGDLIWSYPNVNENIKTCYDVIIFVHASQYSYVDNLWLEKNKDAKIFYITNEYNLGEPRILWNAIKSGRKYSVISNHPEGASKIVTKYTDEWNIVNLNSLIYSPKQKPQKTLLEKLLYGEKDNKYGCIYYGSFRKDRKKYFEKYLDKNVLLSTHIKNMSKFSNLGVTSGNIGRIDWSGSGLFPYKQSLYIEDEKTHVHYNFLANRFYEALNYNVTPIFSIESEGTVKKSGYNITKDYFIQTPNELKEKENLECLDDWHELAKKEKHKSLLEIKKIIEGNV